ncbi:hypothetical protein JYU34_002915 [Plutella xylostella]|uniref:DOCKER domain-containing protein n=1 Tax=Plutella xylostella TaxID=51655 RepID=A0ABQ7R3G5_PLUXY|nr:hypothetical protein JYU34_002915 [Plutella xylostella]
MLFLLLTDILPLDNDLDFLDQFYPTASPDGENKPPSRAPFNSETSRNLLLLVCWVLKWSSDSALAACVGSLSRRRLLALLQLVHRCFAHHQYKYKLHAAPVQGTVSASTSYMRVLKWSSDSALAACVGSLSRRRLLALLQLVHRCFAHHQYKGRKETMQRTQQAGGDIKARLEDVILGQGSAREDFIMRRKAGTQMSGKRERWRKECWGRPPPAPPPPPALAPALAAEVSMTLLHTIEIIVKTCSVLECGQAVATAALQVLLAALQRPQSVSVLQHMLATVRSLIIKLGGACGVEGRVCRVVLAHCGAAHAASRAHASATLYTLMRTHYTLPQNFSGVKMQMTMSLSSLVGTRDTLSEHSLRRALRTMLTYAEHDQDLAGTSFPEQVKDLVFNLHMILSDTVKMKEFQQDPEMLLDLMHRIARGYQHSPDLRLTWLSNMAQKHMERSNHTEAGMCLVQAAALAAEAAGWSRGAALLEPVTHNALLEAVTEPAAPPRLPTDLQALLEHAASELMTAGMYETVNEVYKVLIPIAEQNRDYKKLANIHGKLTDAFTRIEQLHGKRVFGTYFRVGFYGAPLGDLANTEFIYKEHALTKLPEIFSRLEVRKQ